MPYYFMDISELPYDPASKESVLSYAETLRGKTLRQVASDMDLPDTEAKDKGGFGKDLEIVAFRYKPNSEPGPDLPDAGMEIKSLPIIPSDKRDTDPNGWKPKERLQLHNIDYYAIVDETWENCSLREKCSHMLVVTDEYVKGGDPLDFTIHDVFELEFPLSEDEPTLKADWEYVKKKVLDGQAHTISASDTDYLDVARHGGKGEKGRTQPFSDAFAKTRGFGLKQSYIRSLYASRSSEAVGIPRLPEEKELTVEELLRKKFAPYVGKTLKELQDIFGTHTNAKNMLEITSNAILGVTRKQRNNEFGKAGYIFKNINLEIDGSLVESVSLPVINLDEILNEDWEDSAFRMQLFNRICVVVWQKTEDTDKWKREHETEPVPTVLHGVVFTGIPEEIIEEQGAIVWERTRIALAASDIASFPKLTENHYFHYRTHANNNQPKMILPDGTPMTKRSFWINAGYIAELVRPYLNNLTKE